MSITNVPSLNHPPAALRLLIRPIFFLVLGFHALLLFVPLPSEQKPTEPNDKKDPLKITQIPTATSATKPVVPPKPTVNVSAKPAVPSGLPSSRDRQTSSSLLSVSSPVQPSSPLQPSEASSPSAAIADPHPVASPPPAQLAAVDPSQALYELLADIPAPYFDDAAFTNTATREQFPQPEAFFRPLAHPDDSPEGLPGLDGAPRLSIGEEPEFFYKTFFEQPLNAIFEQVSPVGDYGGGRLYKLQRGGYTVYLNLVPAKGLGQPGTIVAVWRTDPRVQ